MAQVEGMSIKLVADVSDLKAGLKIGEDGVLQFAKTISKLEDQLKSFKDGLKNATNPESLNRLNRAIEATSQRINAIKNFGDNAGKGLGSIAPGANQASNALLNLGRVAQDAPFGFIGIQNNINPLLESFQRLKAETGSTKTALQALGSSLLGGAGLGLAVSVITSLLTVAAQHGLLKFGDATDAVKKKLEDAKAKTEEYKKAVDSIYASTAKEIVNVQSLIAVIDSETATRERKNKALEGLKKIQPEIFNGLKLEGDAVIGLNDAYLKYLQQIKTVIAVKVKQQQLEKVTEDILKKEGVTLTEQEKNFKAAGESIVKSIEAKNQIADRANNITLKRVAAENKANASLQSDYKQQKVLLKDIADLQAGVQVNIDPDKEKKTKTYVDIIAEFRKEVAGLQTQLAQGLITPQAFDDSVVKKLTDTVGKLGEIKAPAAVISKLTLEFNDNIYRNAKNDFQKKFIDKQKEEPIEVPTQVDIKPNISDGSLTALSETLNREKLLNFLNKAGVTRLTPIGIDLPISIATSTKQLEAVYAAIQAKTALLNKQFSDVFNQQLQSAFTGSFETIGKSIGDALTGGDFGKSLGQGFFLLVGNFVTEMGKQLIQVYALAKLTQIAFKNILKNPGLALVAGVGLVALGAAMKNVASKGFATGGYVSGPGTKTSDSIPAQLSKGEYVIKAAAVDKFGVGFLNNINSMQMPTLPAVAIGAGASNIAATNNVVTVDGEFRISGDNLRLLLNRANQNYSRNT